MNRVNKFSFYPTSQKMHISFHFIIFLTFLILTYYWIVHIKLDISAIPSTPQSGGCLSRLSRCLEKLQIHLCLIPMPKDDTGHWRERGGKGAPFMASWPYIPVLWFARPSYCALCFIHQEHNSFLPLWKSNWFLPVKIEFLLLMNWEAHVLLWSLPHSSWNLELSRQSARGVISVIFICIFHRYLFTQKEKKAFTWVC